MDDNGANNVILNAVFNNVRAVLDQRMAERQEIVRQQILNNNRGVGGDLSSDNHDEDDEVASVSDMDVNDDDDLSLSSHGWNIVAPQLSRPNVMQQHQRSNNNNDPTLRPNIIDVIEKSKYANDWDPFKSHVEKYPEDLEKRIQNYPNIVSYLCSRYIPRMPPLDVFELMLQLKPDLFKQKANAYHNLLPIHILCEKIANPKSGSSHHPFTNSGTTPLNNSTNDIIYSVFKLLHRSHPLSMQVESDYGLPLHEVCYYSDITPTKINVEDYHLLSRVIKYMCNKFPKATTVISRKNCLRYRKLPLQILSMGYITASKRSYKSNAGKELSINLTNHIWHMYLYLLKVAHYVTVNSKIHNSKNIDKNDNGYNNNISKDEEEKSVSNNTNTTPTKTPPVRLSSSSTPSPSTAKKLVLNSDKNSDGTNENEGDKKIAAKVTAATTRKTDITPTPVTHENKDSNDDDIDMFENYNPSICCLVSIALQHDNRNEVILKLIGDDNSKQKTEEDQQDQQQNLIPSPYSNYHDYQMHQLQGWQNFINPSPTTTTINIPGTANTTTIANSPSPHATIRTTSPDNNIKNGTAPMAPADHDNNKKQSCQEEASKFSHCCACSCSCHPLVYAIYAHKKKWLKLSTLKEIIKWNPLYTRVPFNGPDINDYYEWSCDHNGETKDTKGTNESEEGRLPLNIAIEQGMKFHEGLNDILVLTPQALGSRDCKSHLYPFMLAAAGNNNTLDTVYRLLRESPIVASGLTEEAPWMKTQKKIDSLQKEKDLYKEKYNTLKDDYDTLQVNFNQIEKDNLLLRRRLLQLEQQQKQHTATTAAVAAAATTKTDGKTRVITKMKRPKKNVKQKATTTGNMTKATAKVKKTRESKRKQVSTTRATAAKAAESIAESKKTKRAKKQ